MEKSTNLEAKYLMVFPIFMLLCSFVILWATLVVGFSMNTITGLILLALGVLMLTRPVFTITQNTLEWKNLLGRTGKSVVFKLDEIEVKDNKIFVAGQKMTGLWVFNINQDQVAKHIESIS